MLLSMFNASHAQATRRLGPLCFCAVVAMLLPQCDGSSYQPLTVERPVAVIADLGENASVDAGTTIVLDGSPSHLGAGAEGLTLTYHWSLASLPITSRLGDGDLVPVGEDPSRVEFSPDESGIYAVTLQVHDGNDESDLAHAVLEVGGGNACPIADAGPDLAAQVGLPVTLDGGASNDPDATVGDDDDSAGADSSLDYN